MSARSSPCVVVLIGPDGSGKSTVARGLLEASGLPFRRRVLVRFSLDVLPPIDRLVTWFERHISRIPEPDARHVGMRLPLPLWRSVLITAYFAVDMWLGRWQLRRARGEQALFVFDRSFFDFYVHMGHRRLPRWYLRALERLVPRPDLILYIRRDAAAIYRDKAELTLEEIARQQGVIDTLMRGYPQARVVDGNHGVDAAVAHALAHLRATAPLAPVRRPSVVAAVRTQALVGPARAAIEQGSRQLTYEALIRAADRIAHRLRARGVGPDVRVAVHGRRGAGLIAAVLAVWRAGGTVLVLDATLPLARRRMLAHQAEVRTWVYVGDDEGPVARAEAVPVEPTTGHLLGADAPATALVDDPAGAAYVCFTSGSTGTPKGVVGTHEGLAHFIAWQADRFGITTDDRVAHLTHVMFDVVWRDLWLPLTTGATIVIPEEGDDRPDRVLAWLDRRHVSAVHVVPSLAQVWLSAAPPPDPAGALRLTFFAGEPLIDRLVTSWRQRFPATEVVNLYGPTETTLAKCAAVVPVPPREGVQAVGAPLPDTVVLVLGANDACLPPTEEGELCIRTPYRSRGYLDTQSADQQRFAINPYTGDGRDVVYRTGDVGWYDIDGTVHVRGRLDHQIKIRGVRVEPAEVERAIARVPGVSQAVVVARRNAAGAQELAAYYVAAGPAFPTPSAVRRALEDELPLALVPSWLMRLEALPLTTTGKIDRAALPDPRGVWSGEEYRPADADEDTVAQAWRQVLGAGPASRDADFFAVGGDSIRAVLWSVRIEDVAGLPVPLPVVYAERTVGRLADWLRRARAGIARPLLFDVLGPERPSRVYAFPPLLGYGRAYAHLAQALSSHAVVAFDFPESGDPIAAYVDAITAADDGPYLFLGYSAGGNLAFEVARELEARGRRVSGIIMLDARRVTVPEVLDDAAMDEIVAGNLTHLGTLLAHDQHWSVLLSDEAGRRRLTGRLRAFLRYENGRVNAGHVQAPIAYIHSAESRVSAAWAEATRGGFSVHAGAGRHLEMALDPYARHNGQVIAGLLATMEAAAPMACGAPQGRG